LIVLQINTWNEVRKKKDLLYNLLDQGEKELIENIKELDSVLDYYRASMNFFLNKTLLFSKHSLDDLLLL